MATTGTFPYPSIGTPFWLHRDRGMTRSALTATVTLAFCADGRGLAAQARVSGLSRVCSTHQHLSLKCAKSTATQVGVSRDAMAARRASSMWSGGTCRHLRGTQVKGESPPRPLRANAHGASAPRP